MTLLRSLVYALLFYSGTALLVLAGLLLAPFGSRPVLGVVRRWVEMNHWLGRNVLGIRTRVEGKIPPGQHLIAVKHQSSYETTELVRISNLPVIVIKRELADLPFFGWVTRLYGIIAVDRTAGAKAVRRLVEESKQARATGRGIIIYPEGTRVRAGETPALKSGFAAIYRALGLPVVPVAVDTGRLWGRGLVHRSGTVTIKVGETIPPGLKREEVATRVHAAINALELAAQARS
jgi:1-acyl-sn-glycerol-3-phosphate acyltransferase